MNQDRARRAMEAMLKMGKIEVAAPQRLLSGSAMARHHERIGDMSMCLNCGCGEPNERHGNDANITLDDVRRAGEANGQSVEESLRNMGMAARQVVAGQGEHSTPATGQSQQG